jgi:CelD/BcsL family acetyltransferase involved in cellulose biosynthesis
MTDGHTFKVFGRGDLPGVLQAWRALAVEAVEDNVYYDPRYALPQLGTVAAGTKLRFVTSWRDGALVGFLPVETPRLRLPIAMPAGKAWEGDYNYSCMPLLHRACPDAAAATLVDGLASIARGEWLFPVMNAKGPVYAAIQSALEKRGAPAVELNGFERACLTPDQPFDDYLKSTLSNNLRRNMARRRRRLEEQGPVSFETHVSGEGLNRAVREFLRIEASGWKGKRGTALDCTGRTRAFALAAFGGAEPGFCRADLLTVSDKSIAAAVTVFSGSTGFTVKTAYDESYAAMSAGLLLDLEIIKNFLEEKWAAKLDSGAAGPHAIDDFWPGRIAVADLAFSLSPVAAETRLAAFAAVARANVSVKARLKKILGRD